MKLLFGLLFAALSCLALTGAVEKSAACLLRHSQNGNGAISCVAYIPSWSYNSEADKCVQFVYGGCHGNSNRFKTQAECESACRQ